MWILAAVFGATKAIMEADARRYKSGRGVRFMLWCRAECGAIRKIVDGLHIPSRLSSTIFLGEISIYFTSISISADCKFYC